MKMPTLSLIKAIAVDYYGTLVDVGQPFITIKKWFAEQYTSYINNIDAVYMTFLKEHAKSQYGKEFYLGQVLLMKSYKKVCNKYNIPIFSEAFQELIIKLFTQPLAFSGAQQAIENLRKYYPVLLLTNADNQILYESIKMQGFEFDYILSSEDLQCNKPAIKMFQSACELLNTPAKSVLMIGDSLNEDIHGALSFGLQAIWINSKETTKEELDEKPALQLSSIFEIEPILCKEYL